MDTATIQIDPTLMAIVPLITGVLQICKVLPVAKKLIGYFPFFGLILGLAVGLFLTPTDTVPLVKVIYGLTIGLSASGLYSNVKSAGELGTTIKNGNGK